MRAFLAVLRDIWEFSSEGALRQFFAEHHLVFFDESQRDFVEKLLSYIHRVRDIKPKELRDMLKESVLNEEAEQELSFFEILKREDREDGKRDEKLQTARRMLEKGFSPAIVLDVTELSEEDLHTEGLLLVCR